MNISKDNTYIHMYIHTYIHTHIHTYIHIHTVAGRPTSQFIVVRTSIRSEELLEVSEHASVGKSEESAYAYIGCHGQSPAVTLLPRVYVCMSEWVSVCMYIRYVCIYVRMYVLNVCMYVCMYVRMYVRMYVCMYVCMYVWTVCMYERYVFMYVSM